MTTTDTLPDTDLYTCEACSVTADADDFRAYDAQEIDDPICDECLAVHRDAAAADESNRLAYYYR